MRVLVIGSSGQDGSLLVDHYLNAGQEVFGASLSRVYEPVNNSDNYRHLFVQFSDPNNSQKVLDGINPDYIFHMGAIHAASGEMNSLGERSYREMFSCHVSITHNILNWLRFNRNSKLIVALSSQMYSANHKSFTIDESSDISPSSVYGETKAEAFELIKKYRRENSIWAAGAILFNHTSIRSKPSFLFPQIAYQFIENEKLGGKVINVRDAYSYLDISSAVEVSSALVKMINQEIPEDFVFGSGKLCQIKDVIHKASELLNIKSGYEIISENSSSGGFNLVSNPRKAKEILGWDPVLTPEEILVEIIKERLA